MDINLNKDFAKYLEMNLPKLMKHKIECAAIAAKADDGAVYTGYYNVDTTDMAVLAHNIISDVVLEIVKSNIDTIREALEGDDDARD